MPIGFYDLFGKPSGVEVDLGRGMQSFRSEEYKREVERLQRVSPKTAVLDTSTGLLTSENLTPTKLGGLDLYPKEKVQVYTYPITNELIKDIGGYLKEKDIPYSTTPKKFTSFKDIEKVQPTYDLLGIHTEKFETKKAKKFLGVQYKRPECLLFIGRIFLKLEL